LAVALYLDSAVLEDIAPLLGMYPIAGVTTNPSILLAAVERGQRLDDLGVLNALLELGVDVVFMQPVGESAGDLREGAARYIEVDPQRVVPKLPMTSAGLSAGLALKRDGARLAFTAVYSLAQAYCAASVGAEWIIPYFGRLRRAGIDACQRVAHMTRLLAAIQPGARILVASIKMPADLIEATLAGAHDITAQPAVISALADDPLTASAVTQFSQDAERLRSLLG
jgi:TalC/MipB family fructose-6-phosphate aldolase